MGRDAKEWVGIHLKFDKNTHEDLIILKDRYNTVNKSKISKTKLIEVAVSEFINRYKNDIDNIIIK